ncbi:hypothetical protein AMATHDRAFT_66243 [Amanita thiersii Skay4041]|uniref:D-isomer specific 2-hydroxyacid dehydrogenase NAD-binding domain-containing protein n=1 Tax=Amanita thiersii Skay4041 TaxID=703135 RepID=A0A2A9NDE8_9AGAR|nr:hypothetical protein AMATHDRAFT_66243 [Amanita thiersii Skay4041]
MPNSPLKVVVTRDLGPDVMPLLGDQNDIDLIVWPHDRAVDKQWLLEKLPGTTGLLVMLTDKVTPEILDAAGPTLRVVSTMSVEHLDIRAIAKRRIKLGYTPDVLTDAVADLSVMLALMAGRNARQTMSVVDKGEWPNYTWSPFLFCGPQLSASTTSTQRTVGFLGFGRIARATLSRLIPFGITDCIYTSNPDSPYNPDRDAELKKEFPASLRTLKKVSLSQLASDSDMLFVLTPGGAETRHVVNEEFLKGMKKTSVLVNTSRGTVVDSFALAKALREGWLWGAGVDVVEGEPRITQDHSLVQEPKCVILPHIGSATLETRLGMATLAAKNLLAGIRDEAMPAGLDLSQYCE